MLTKLRIGDKRGDSFDLTIKKKPRINNPAKRETNSDVAGEP
jgi:hypothetical protein